MSTGQIRFLDGALKSPTFKLVRGDNLDLPALTAAMKGADFVFHLAANADIRDGWKHPEKDLQQNTIATFNVLEAMRAHGVKRIAFSSTGSVYGEARVTPETDAFPIQTSFYGASKTAGKGLLPANAEGAQIDEAYIFRFVSILGERYTHGHVFAFYQQLVAHPDHLRVLGNGNQRKSYLYVQDCIGSMLHVTRKAPGRHWWHSCSPPPFPGSTARTSTSTTWIGHYLGPESAIRNQNFGVGRSLVFIMEALAERHLGGFFGIAALLGAAGLAIGRGRREALGARRRSRRVALAGRSHQRIAAAPAKVRRGGERPGTRRGLVIALWLRVARPPDHQRSVAAFLNKAVQPLTAAIFRKAD